MRRAVPLRFLFERNKKYLPGLLLLTLLEISRAYLGVQFAMVTRRVIDCAQSGSGDALSRAGLLLAAVIAGIMGLYAVAQYLRGWLRATLDREWKLRLSHTLLHGDYAAVSAYHSGELVNRLTSDVDAVNGGVIALIPNVAALLTRLVSAVWLMAAMEPEKFRMGPSNCPVSCTTAVSVPNEISPRISRRAHQTSAAPSSR